MCHLRVQWCAKPVVFCLLCVSVWFCLCVSLWVGVWLCVFVGLGLWLWVCLCVFVVRERVCDWVWVCESLVRADVNKRQSEGLIWGFCEFICVFVWVFLWDTRGKLLEELCWKLCDYFIREHFRFESVLLKICFFSCFWPATGMYYIWSITLVSWYVIMCYYMSFMVRLKGK